MNPKLDAATREQLIAAIEAVERLANSYASDPERRFVADNAAWDIRSAINVALLKEDS